MLDDKPSIEKLRWIMTQLRDPITGCPWDLKQTFASIVPHTLEEAYEVADAIEQGDLVELEKELGDLLFQVIFYAQLGTEKKLFDFNSIVAAICEKLIRRHPHVFGDSKLATEQAVKANWEDEKAKERSHKNDQENLSILADIPKSLPALSQANKIQKRCAHVGFDWQNIDDVFAKVEEEVQEVKEQLHGDPALLSEELGDLMFAVVNVCRHAKQDPEAILRAANQKFTQRFEAVEAKVNQSGKPIQSHHLESLDAFWQSVKEEERKA